MLSTNPTHITPKRRLTAFVKNFQRSSDSSCTGSGSALVTVLVTFGIHYSGDHSKCRHSAHQGYQWKNRDLPEAQVSLVQFLGKALKDIQMVG
jgi:fatty-acid desaturase